MSLGFPVTRRSSIILGRYKIRISDDGFNHWGYYLYTHNGQAWELVYMGTATHKRYTSALLVAIRHLNEERGLVIPEMGVFGVGRW